MMSYKPHDQPEDMLWALVPVKSLEQSKHRLQECLGRDRPGLTVAMLEDVLDALKGSREIDRIAVVTADRRVAGVARRKGALVIDESVTRGMNQALELGIERITLAGAAAVAVIPADVPLATAGELDRLILEVQGQVASGKNDIVGIVASKDRGGTNFLYFQTRCPLPLMYGPDSFRKHSECAEKRGSLLIALDCEEISLDIDEQPDLAEFLQLCVADPRLRNSRSWKFLSQQGYVPAVAKSPESRVPSESPSEGYKLPELKAILTLDRDNDLETLCGLARDLRDQGHGDIVTYSRKVFIPLTRLCRDFCHYCTFATVPRKLDHAYMSVDEALSIARQGQDMGCKEALFTLGERPELRHEAARRALDEMGFGSTLEYVAHVAEKVLQETGLLPHINAGCMEPDEIAMLRRVSASMGIMLENVSARLCGKGQVHYGSPDKHPELRLRALAEAGKAGVPFTTGILIGIGETRRERIDSLLAIRDLHRKYGHIQEVIVQNFVPKADTKMAGVAPPATGEMLWTIAMARMIFGPEMSIQAPPNLSPGKLRPLIDAGINDWGGVSPLTPDHVNPESPWPRLDALSRDTARAGKSLQERLTVYPAYVRQEESWLDGNMIGPVLKLSDGQGLAREDEWISGQSEELPEGMTVSAPLPAGGKFQSSGSARIASILETALGSDRDLGADEISELFTARDEDFIAVCQAADWLRNSICGEAVSYVINRNINYTNICTYRCKFCAFAKGRKNTPASDAPYLKSPQEVAQMAIEAWQRGATEVCLQGGIHPKFTGQTYIDICSAVRSAVPDMHIHAFSPLEVTHGARSLGVSIPEFLEALKNAGLRTLPGTAAEILSDEVRARICPDKINTREWLDVVEAAHELGLMTTATIMFGHVDHYHHWAVHLQHILDLQRRSLGVTEFVPLPFVADEAPIYRRARSRRGPTLREAILMHAVSRLVLSPFVINIQTSWVKMGLKGAALCLQAGANDMGGTLMNESITRAAGASHGQEMAPETLQEAILSCRRLPVQRNTFYDILPEKRGVGAGTLNVIGSACSDLYGNPVRDEAIPETTGSSRHYRASVPRRS